MDTLFRLNDWLFAFARAGMVSVMWIIIGFTIGLFTIPVAGQKIREHANRETERLGAKHYAWKLVNRYERHVREMCRNCAQELPTTTQHAGIKEEALHRLWRDIQVDARGETTAEVEETWEEWPKLEAIPLDIANAIE